MSFSAAAGTRTAASGAQASAAGGISDLERMKSMQAMERVDLWELQHSQSFSSQHAAANFHQLQREMSSGDSRLFLAPQRFYAKDSMSSRQPEGRGLGRGPGSPATPAALGPDEPEAPSPSEYWILDPIESTLRQVWDVVSAVLILYIAFCLPVFMSFEPRISDTVLYFDLAVDLFFLLDIALSFMTGFYKDGIMVRNPSKVAAHYLMGWFLPDFLSSFPFDLCVLGPDAFLVLRQGASGTRDIGLSRGEYEQLQLLKMVKVLRLLRLFRVARLNRIAKRMKDQSKLKHTQVTLGGFFFLLVLVSHWIGCFWFMIAQMEGLHHGTWVSEMVLPGDQEPGGLILHGVTHKYLVCLFHAIMVMSTIGSEIMPVTDAEIIYSIVSMLIGASLFAYGISNMGSLFFNLSRNDMAYRQQMDEINEFMQARGLPMALRARVREYYDNLYARRRFFDADEILSGLTRNLKADVLIAMHEQMVLKNNFFREMDPAFVGEVIQRLEILSFMPGEVIVNEGARGEEMFFIYEGKVEVTVKDILSDLSRHVAYLGPSDFFGEIALLEEFNVRSATVTACTFSDLYTLSKKSVEDVLEIYPGQRFRWEKISLKRKQELERRKDPENRAGRRHSIASVGGLSSFFTPSFLSRNAKPGGAPPSDADGASSSSAIADGVPPTTLGPGPAQDVFHPPLNRLSDLAEGVEAESEAGLPGDRPSDASSSDGAAGPPPRGGLRGGRLAPVSPKPQPGEN